MYCYICDIFVLFNVPTGKYCAGKPGFVPSTVLGILEILKRCEVPTFGKNVCVVNRTKHLGEFLPNPTLPQVVVFTKKQHMN